MPGARGGRLLEHRSADVRLTVALAARDLFLECHSTAVTVETIAQRAKVSERTFYRHFASKADLVSPLFERSDRSLISTLRESVPGTRDAIDTLVDVFTGELAEDPAQHAELFQLLMDTPEFRIRWESTDPNLVDAVADWLSRWSVHPGDRFSRRVTALAVLAASRAAYLEWVDGARDGGFAGLRALHGKAFATLAQPWQPI